MPAERREITRYAIAEHELSVKLGCKILGLSRSVYYRQPNTPEDAKIKQALLQLAKEHVRWGFGKMNQAIRKAGYLWNHKRIRRVYCELKLNLRKKPKKRLPARERLALIQPLNPNYCWSMDFMSDALTSGQKIRSFNILEDFNRECLGILLGKNMPTKAVTSYLDFIISFKGCPQIIRVDNGPEFTSKEFITWASRRQIVVNHIQPGKPAQNGYIERFNRTYRESVLDLYLFDSVEEAQRITDEWLIKYNHVRPHEALGNLTPIEFLKKLRSLDGMPSNELMGAAVKS